MLIITFNESRSEFLKLLQILICIILSIYNSGCSKCPPLEYTNLEHGHIIPLGNDKYRFECHQNFFLTGPSIIRCLKGNWTSEKAPACYHAENRCDKPSEIANGDIYGLESRQVGTVIQYMCHPGHSMLGKAMRTCVEGGTWNGITPACINESESLQNIAERLGTEFIQKAGSHSSSSTVQQSRYLDSSSIKNGLELVILIDRSSSVDPHDLNIGKSFIKFLFEQFGIENGHNVNGTRAAVIAFGTKVDIIFNLDNSSIDSPLTASEVIDDKILPNGGGTAMVPAFTVVFLKVEPLLRRAAKRVLFLISDGEPNVGNEGITPEDMAVQLKDHTKFEIFAVGIGPDINAQTMASVASDPIMNHVFMLKKYSDLADILDLIKNKPTEEPPPKPEKCGYLTTENWPWIAAVYVSQELENTTKLNLCAGVLICSEWVLTSASCFFRTDENNVTTIMNTQETFVILGENHLLKQDSSQQSFYAVNVSINPKYNSTDKLLDNLALIKLNTQAPMGKFRPACLPPTDRTIPLHLESKMNVTIAGWGTTTPAEGDEMISPGNLRFKLAAKIITLAEENECRKSVKNKRIPENTIFCAETSFSKEPCIGIPGSPAIGEDSHTGFNHVLGILSARKNCDKGYSQYTELRRYIPWINRVTKNCHFSHYT